MQVENEYDREVYNRDFMLHVLMPISRSSMRKIDYLGANATSQQTQALERNEHTDQF
jgi:hypothetical protein